MVRRKSKFTNPKAKRQAILRDQETVEQNEHRLLLQRIRQSTSRE